MVPTVPFRRAVDHSMDPIRAETVLALADSQIPAWTKPQPRFIAAGMKRKKKKKMKRPNQSARKGGTMENPDPELNQPVSNEA